MQYAWLKSAQSGNVPDRKKFADVCDMWSRAMLIVVLIYLVVSIGGKGVCQGSSLPWHATKDEGWCSRESDALHCIRHCGLGKG